MERELVTAIAWFAVGFVVGGYGERWLLWRRLTHGTWSYRRLLWFGYAEREAAQKAGAFAATAVLVRLDSPLQALLWFVHSHRRLVVGVLTGVLVGVVIAVAR